MKDVITYGFSGLALLLSLITLQNTARKDEKTRRQSIQDDFWLRKVLGPLVVEPLIKEVFETLHALPPDFASPGWTVGELEKFGHEYQIKHQRLALSLRSLALLDEKLCKQTLDSLDHIEDVIVEYCGANAGRRRTATGEVLKTRAETQGAILDQLLVVLNAIRTYQATAV